MHKTKMLRGIGSTLASKSIYWWGEFVCVCERERDREIFSVILLFNI